MKNILVAVDFTEGTNKILSFAKDLAQTYLSKVWIVYVASPVPDYLGYSVGPQYIVELRDADLKQEHKALKKYADELNYSGINSESIILNGGTVNMLVAEIKKLHIELAIIGHHKHGFFHKAFYGRTDVSFIEHANIPILVIPV